MKALLGGLLDGIGGHAEDSGDDDARDTVSTLETPKVFLTNFGGPLKLKHLKPQKWWV